MCVLMCFIKQKTLPFNFKNSVYLMIYVENTDCSTFIADIPAPWKKHRFFNED